MSGDLQNLTAAEERLLQCASAGTEWKGQGNGEELRADVIAHLIAAPEHSPYPRFRDAVVHPEGLFIENAIVSGEYLNLDGVKLRTKLFFENCVFTQNAARRAPDGGVCLRDSTMTTVSFERCKIYKIDARRGKLSGNLYVQDSTIIAGINLHNCEIGGYLSIRGCDLYSDEYDQTEQDPALAIGNDEKHELYIADDICAIDAEAIRVQDSVLISTSPSGRKLRAYGQISLERAQIGGNLDCRGASIVAPKNPPEIDDDQRIALHAAAVRVGGSVLLGEGFCAEGEVRFEHSEITGDFWCAGGQFSNPPEKIKSAKQQQRAASGFRFYGSGRAQDIPAALNLRSAAVEEGIYLEDPEITGFSTSIDGRLVLSNARCLVYCDSKGAGGAIAQPSGRRTELDAFHYQRLGDCTTSARKRTAWLNGQIKEHIQLQFRPQPWKRLTAVLQDMGYNDDARIIAMKRQVALRRSRSLSPLQKLANLFLGITIGHGYRSNLAIAWALLIVVPCIFIFSVAAETGWMAPQNSSVQASQDYWDRDDCRLPVSYRELNPAFYTVDMFVPIIDNMNNDDWGPAPAARACARRAPENPSALQQTLSAGMNTAYAGGLRNLFERGLLEIARWLLVVTGWILVPLFLAGITGIVKRFEE